MSLLPDTPREVVELFGLAAAVCLAALFGWAAWIGVGLIMDWRRSTRSRRPIGEPAPAVAEPAPVVKPGRSPFAPKQREAK